MDEVEIPLPGRSLPSGRLSRIRPHRQVWLLCGVSVVVAVVIAGAALSVLVPTRRSLDHAKRTLVPPAHALDVAEASYRATTAALQQRWCPGT